MDQQAETIVLKRDGQFLEVRPPCEEVRNVLRTTVHAPQRHGESIVIGAESGRMYREHAVLDEPVLECFAGLMPVVSRTLNRAGYRVVMQGTPQPFTKPEQTNLEGIGTCDLDFLDLIRFDDRGLIRYVPAGVEPARLIVQAALAWPSLTVVAVVARIDEARRLRRNLLRHVPNVVAISSHDSVADERVGRVVVTTFNGLGHPGVEFEKRDIVIVSNAVEASRSGPLSVLGHARRARMYGLIPLDQQMAPEDSDAIRLLFGFTESTIPKHGMTVPEVIVVKCAVRGGRPLPSKISATNLKRQAIWQNPLRNRRIARIARHLRDNTGELFQREPAMAQALNRRTDLAVLVLVENLEHGEALARQLPGWPLVAAGKPWIIATAMGAELAPFPGVMVGTEIKNAIATFDGARADLLGKWDVIIRADGGVGMPECPRPGQSNIVYGINNLAQSCPFQDRQLVLIDFDDRHHPVLRRWSRQRWAAYRREGWFAPGVSPEQGRVEQFLATRPAITKLPEPVVG